MWDELGRIVRKRPNPPQNVRELGLAPQQDWWNIRRGPVRLITRSMIKRSRAVIDNKWDHTRYQLSVTESTDPSPDDRRDRCDNE